jgi:stage II sporulation protein D
VSGFLLLLFCSTSFAAIERPPTIQSAVRDDAAPWIRVRISPGDSFLRITGSSLVVGLVNRPDRGASVPSSEWWIDCKDQTLGRSDANGVRRIPRGGLLISSAEGVVNLNGKRYLQELRIYPTGSGCTVVNRLPIERYLESVVNSEFNSKWAREAVAAQVVAARTYAWFQLLETRRDPSKLYDVESSQKDQVYTGLDRVDALAREIVQSTRGVILAAGKGKHPIKAFYHSTCGGSTVLPEQVWGGRRVVGFRRGVPCKFCARSPVSEWSLTVTNNEMQDRIERAIRTDPEAKAALPRWFYKNPASWLLTAIQPKLAHATGSKEQEVELKFISRASLGAVRTARVNAYQFRNWLSPSRLKSTQFKVSMERGIAVFQGRGHGHGVGMCQWGAKAMGERGYKRDQILAHYYPDARVTRQW